MEENSTTLWSIYAAEELEEDDDGDDHQSAETDFSCIYK